MKRAVIAVLVPIALLLLAAPLGALAQEPAPAAPAPAALSEEPQAVPAQDEPTTDEQTTTDEEPTNDLQGGNGDIPQQYTDPLAGEDDNQNSGGQQGQEEAAPVATAPAVQTTPSQLPQTGAPLSEIWIAGLLLLGAGATLRFAFRRREYPYPLPRY